MITLLLSRRSWGICSPCPTAGSSCCSAASDFLSCRSCIEARSMLSSGALKLPANTADLLSRLSPARLMKQLNGEFVDEEVRTSPLTARSPLRPLH